MKTRPCLSTVTFAVCLLFGFSFFAPSRVEAGAYHAMSGIVQEITSTTITILPTGSSKPVMFEWNSRWTRFERDDRATTIESLRIGTRVRLRCSHPLFGPPFLFRVNWDSDARTTRN